MDLDCRKAQSKPKRRRTVTFLVSFTWTKVLWNKQRKLYCIFCFVNKNNGRKNAFLNFQSDKRFLCWRMDTERKCWVEGEYTQHTLLNWLMAERCSGWDVRLKQIMVLNIKRTLNVEEEGKSGRPRMRWIYRVEMWIGNMLHWIKKSRELSRLKTRLAWDNEFYLPGIAQ